MNTITLPAVCDRAAARSIQPDLVERIGDSIVCVEASSVEKIGQAMLQVLASAAKTESGISLKAPSEPLLKAIRLAGLEASLGTDIDAESAA